jgi:hypothetical protein
MRNDWRSRWEQEQEEREEELKRLREETRAKEVRVTTPTNKKGQYLLPLEAAWTQK